MNAYSRFAIYHLPEGELAAFGAHWLGWDVWKGRAVFPPEDVAPWTEAPRKYGFHGTVKPPFRLAEGAVFEDVAHAAREIAESSPKARLEGLQLAQLGSFFALVPSGDAASLADVAGEFVQKLDGFRAPPSDAELDRRRAKGLTARQEELLNAWGYPYVLDEFRFHLTLTGRVPKASRAVVRGIVEAHLPELPAPYIVDNVALVGERPDGRFELIERLTLTG